MYGFPEVKYLDKNLLHIDLSYQRNTGIEDDIFDHFEHRLFQPLDVNLRSDGSYWVMEGGNRTRAAQRKEDITFVPVRVQQLSLDMETQTFDDLNGKRKALTEKDKLKGKVLRNLPEAVLVSSLISLANERKVKTPENIKSYLLLAKRNPKVMERIWKLVLDVTPPKTTIRKRVIKALFLLETNSNEGENIWTEFLLNMVKEKGPEAINMEMVKTGINVNTGSDDLTLDAIRHVVNNWKETH